MCFVDIYELYLNKETIMQKVLNTLDDTGVTLVWEAVDGCFGKYATHIFYGRLRLELK